MGTRPRLLTAARPATIRAALLLAATLLGLLAPAARAWAGCGEQVCIELTLPPHVNELRRGSTLDSVLVLPAPAREPSTVKVMLLAEGSGACSCWYETIQPGSAWKRSSLSLGDVSPGAYRVGVARPPKYDAAKCTCTAREGRFLARTIRITP
ncbi:MAG TPA: hypothetical protein VML50_05920 [Anaeromyxobacter sp.]|nr:hypothetical protein [Anaeromyxobacter sp.]